MRIGISGTPGTGKTSIAKALSKQLDILHIDVSHFAVEKDWTIEYDDRRDSAIIDIDRIMEHLESMDDVIVDVHYAELFECDIIFVIRCDPKLLYERLISRGYSKEKVKENLLSEMLDSCLINAINKIGGENVFEVVSGDIDENVDYIIGILSGNSEGESVGNHSGVHYLTVENLDFIGRL